jgi:transketolase
LYNDENNNNNSKNIATREVYGHALKELGKDTHDINKQIVVLDADVKNSTFSIEFMKAHPDRFIECFIAE